MMSLKEIDEHLARFKDHSILMDRPTAMKLLTEMRAVLAAPISTHLDKVARFNKAFLRPEPTCIGFPKYEEAELILRLIREEVKELHAAFGYDLAYDLVTTGRKDFVAAVDGFCDIEVVLLYGVWQCGLHAIYPELFQEVHASNMSKLDENGLPIYRDDKKILKGPNYFSPKIRELLIANGWTPPKDEVA